MQKWKKIEKKVPTILTILINNYTITYQNDTVVLFLSNPFAFAETKQHSKHILKH